MSNPSVREKWTIMGLAAIIVIAAGLRLYHLDVPSFRADTMLFFDICHRPVNAWVVFTQWMELMGRAAQFPFSLAAPLPNCALMFSILPRRPS